MTEHTTIASTEDFNASMGAVEYGGVLLVEHEHGGFSAYGHIDPDAMASAATGYFWDACEGSPGPEDEYKASDVEHVYAVLRHEGSADDDGWLVTWRDVTSETPGAFPLTVVTTP